MWRSGFLQHLIGTREIASVPQVLGLSILGSQIVSNVPFVALYLPLLGDAVSRPPVVLALAAGSTIAGNLLLLGAASNVIIVQSAEASDSDATLSFLDFARVGIPLTAAQTLVYWGALALFP